MTRMNIRAIWAVVFLSGALGFSQDSSILSTGVGPASKAVVPRLIRFGGVLKDAGAKPLHGAQDVTFSLYAIESGGDPLWFETQTVEADAQGRYSVLLGAMHPDGLPMDLFTSGEARWLGVSVGKLPEQARVLLVAVPYALKASDADTLGGKPATAFVASDQLKDQVRSEVKTQVTQSGSATRTLVGTASTPQAIGEPPSSFVCNIATDCVAVTQSGSGIGIHATAGSNVAIFGETASTTGRGVSGLASAATGATIGVWGGSYSTSGVGMSGRATATSGATKGMYGVSFSSGGIGVHGDAPAASGSTRGVWGSTSSTGGIAVWGQASAASGTTYGTLGTVASTSGIGASGQANATSGTTIGVLAKVLSSAGTALVANNTAGGKIFSGQYNGVEKASISGSGTLTLPTNGLVAGTNQLVLSGGNVGIGMASPQSKLDVVGSGHLTDNLISNDTAVVYATQTGLGVASVTGMLPVAAIRGDATAATSNLTQGVIGTSNGQQGRGVTGVAWSTTGFTRGVNAVSMSSSGTGMTAFATATSGSTRGIYGEVDSPGGIAAEFENTAEGQVLKGGNGTTQTFAVFTNGNVDAAGTVSAASFSGSGAGLTSLPAANLTGELRVVVDATSPSIIGGFSGNSVTSGVVGATIGGGGQLNFSNRITDNFGVIGGGEANRAGDDTGDAATAPYATVGGGATNTASNSIATVGGGNLNTASGTGATVGGGYNNSAMGDSSTISGGRLNTTTATGAVVPGGDSNTAGGSVSFAAGFRAKANHMGAFVWGDSANADVASTGTNQFIVRAQGGVWFGTTSTPGNDLTAGRFLATSTGAYLTTGGTWTNNSDLNVKTNLAPVNGRVLLAKLNAMPVSTWNYRAENRSVLHLGPMAQDFYAAFGLGEDDKHITTVDEGGVALAGVQALYRMEVEKNREIRRLRNEIARLEAEEQQFESLTRQVTELRALIERLAAERQLLAAARH